MKELEQFAFKEGHRKPPPKSKKVTSTEQSSESSRSPTKESYRSSPAPEKASASPSPTKKAELKNLGAGQRVTLNDDREIRNLGKLAAGNDLTESKLHQASRLKSEKMRDQSRDPQVRFHLPNERPTSPKQKFRTKFDAIDDAIQSLRVQVNQNKEEYTYLFQFSE